jgi:hypothetical protein
LKAKFTGTGTEQWNILLVACPDPGTGADGKPVFDMKGGARKKGPIPCDGKERSFPVYSGTVKGPHKIYVERNGTCFECAEMCVFARHEFVLPVMPGCGCGGPPPKSPYRGYPKVGAGINIPGGTGGYLLFSKTDDCDNTVSIWCTGTEFKFMFEGMHGSGKIGQCSFVPGLNDWIIGYSKCGDLHHLTELEMLNFNGTPSSGFYEYRYYLYDTCANILKVNKNTTATPPQNYPPEKAREATGGTNYSGAPFGTNAPVQP